MTDIILVYIPVDITALLTKTINPNRGLQIESR